MKFLSDPSLSQDLEINNNSIIEERAKFFAWKLIQNAEKKPILYKDKKEFYQELPFFLREVLNRMMMEFDCLPGDKSHRAMAARTLASVLKQLTRFRW